MVFYKLAQWAYLLYSLNLKLYFSIENQTIKSESEIRLESTTMLLQLSL